jgi:uncharacterized membrane protein YvbJ
MKECPYCYTQVSTTEVTCPNCGRPIDQWRTGFYARKPLPARSRALVWAVAVLAFLLILAGFAKACHWV